MYIGSLWKIYIGQHGCPDICFQITHLDKWVLRRSEEKNNNLHENNKAYSI